MIFAPRVNTTTNNYNFYYNIVPCIPAGPAPAPAKGTSAALIVKDKGDLAQDKWDARFSNFAGSTVTIQVSWRVDHAPHNTSKECRYFAMIFYITSTLFSRFKYRRTHPFPCGKSSCTRPGRARPESNNTGSKRKSTCCSTLGVRVSIPGSFLLLHAVYMNLTTWLSRFFFFFFNYNYLPWDSSMRNLIKTSLAGHVTPCGISGNRFCFFFFGFC